MFLNVNAGDWYINDRFQPGLDRLNDWLTQTVEHEDTLAIIEIGAGFNTPSVIRWPGEGVTRAYPNARLIRINSEYPHLPDDLQDRAWPIVTDAGTAIGQIAEILGTSS